MSLLLSLLKSYWPQVAAFIGAVALGFMAAWQLQGLRLDALDVEFAKYRLDVERQASEARQAAFKQQAAWLQEKEDALNAAKLREEKLRRDAAAAQSAARGLRDDLAALRERVSADSVEACQRYVGSLSDVLGECGERYSAVAGIADQCVSDVQTLTEAWPKQLEKTK